MVYDIMVWLKETYQTVPRYIIEHYIYLIYKENVDGKVLPIFGTVCTLNK